jgi:HK97 family phage prohead protease
MPIPTPGTSETESEFIARCMGDEVMNDDYPDDDIRAGVCYTQWRNRTKTMNKFITTTLEIKALGKREFEGYGSVFGNKDWGDDVVLPGAFKRTLSEHKQDDSLPLMFWMHDPSRVPGKWLEMDEDDHGLYVRGQLADTDLGNEIHTLLGMKAVSGLSIGYITRDQDFDNDGVRLIKDADLLETSIVSMPMNPKAQIVHAKSRLSERGEYVPTEDEVAEIKRDTERFLRTKGFGRRAAIAATGELFKGLTSVMLDDPEEKPDLDGVTPDEIEVNAGMSNFKEKLLLQDIDKILKRTF